MGAYKVYFDKVLFPAAPGEVRMKVKNQNCVFTLVNEAELNVLKVPGLAELSFQLLLPSQRHPFALYDAGYRDAAYYVSLLEKLKRERTVFDFSLIRAEDTAKNLSMRVSLEEYSLKESADEGGDMLADITLKQYVAYGTKILTITDGEATEKPGGGGSGAPTQKKYTIKEGDTLPGIAKEQYGNSNSWEPIYKANRKLLDDIAKSRGFPSGSGYWWIFPGTVIVIP